MRLNTPKLLAFGPFTDTVIDLSRGECGLHLIYGPNEAGKSSALRGLLQLLFGIPTQTPDDFIHSYPNLRIGADLKDDQGNVLSVMRRKANINTLRGEDDVAVVEEEELQALLRGEDKDTFRTRFGIDLDELQQGSKSILKGEGRIGEMLFAAGSGLSDVRRVLDGLQNEAEALYKMTGKKPPLNSLLDELSRTRAAIRDIQLSSSEWADHDRALRVANKNKRALDAAYAAKRREQARLERIKSGHPLLARRKELIRELRICSEAPVLPQDFAERWRDLLSDMKVAEQEERSAGEQRDAVRIELEKVKLPDALLDQADTVEALHQEQGSIAKARADRHKLAGELRQAEEDRQRILEGLPGDRQDRDSLAKVLDRGRQGRIQELAARYERLDSRIETARGALAEAGPEIEAVEKELADLTALPEVSGLSAALARLGRDGDLAGRLAAERRSLTLEEEKLAARLKRLGRYRGDLEQTVHTVLPDNRTVDRFESRFTVKKQELADITSDIARTEDEMASVEESLAKLDSVAEGPDEEDLRKAREERDRGWVLVRRTWNLKLAPDDAVLAFVEQQGGQGTLADAFEHSLKKTDVLADGLRQNVASRAEHSRLVNVRNHALERIDRLQARAGEIRAAIRAVHKEWQEIWSGTGVTPGIPAEMRLWLHEFSALVERVEGLGELRMQAAGLEESVVAHTRSLRAGIETAGERVADNLHLDELADAARDIVADVEKRRARQKELSARRSDLTARKGRSEAGLARLEQDLKEWQKEWGEAVSPLGLAGEAVPAEARAVIDETRKLEAFDVRINELRRRIQGIDQDSARFDERVSMLVKELEPSLTKRHSFEAAAGLYHALREAQRSADSRERLNTRLAELE